MVKRFLHAPEEVTAALKEGKVVLDRTGNKYKSINGFIVVSYISGGWGVDPFIGNHEGLYVEEPKPLKLEVGKFYKTRDGRKAWVMECTDMKGAFPFRVATQRECSTYVITKDGRRYFEDTDGTDLVAPWEE